MQATETLKFLLVPLRGAPLVLVAISVSCCRDSRNAIPMMLLSASPGNWRSSWSADRRMAESARISIYVQPRASKTVIAGLHDGCVKIRLAAPPVDGAANAALVEFIAERLNVAKSRVRIVTGSSSRRKVVEVEGVTAAQLSQALALVP